MLFQIELFVRYIFTFNLAWNHQVKHKMKRLNLLFLFKGEEYMKKIFLSCLTVILLLVFSACGTTSTTSTLSKKARISFDISDKSSKTYKEHVQDLWSKTKNLWAEDSKKKYSDEEYIKLGKEIDEAWCGLQAHISIASNGHDENVQDTSDQILGNMAGSILLDTDKLYGERSPSDTKEEREERRNTAIDNLDITIKEYDEALAKLTIK